MVQFLGLLEIVINFACIPTAAQVNNVRYSIGSPSNLGIVIGRSEFD
jgi:hypothetical protein